MKYIKLFLLLVAATAFVACSDDDNDWNSNAGATVNMSQDTLKVKETKGLFDVPFTVSGERNGNVKVTVAVAAADANPATEDTHYLVTSKEIVVSPDQTSGHVEIKAVDDEEINEDRVFIVTITGAEGATLGDAKSTVVVLRDNDRFVYEKFVGAWKIHFTDYDGNKQDKDVTLTVADEGSSDYNHIITATAPGLFNLGVEIDCEWRFRYSFNEQTKTGTLGFICGEQVASYGSSYVWQWASDDGRNFTFNDITTTWALDEDNNIPTSFTWSPNLYIYLYQPGNGFYDVMQNISLTKVVNTTDTNK